jgi:toxin CptA
MQRSFKLRPSRLLALYFLILCAVALISLWLLPLPMLLLTAMSVIVLYWGGYCLLLHANLRMAHSCIAFRLEDRDDIVLVLRNGRHLPCRLSPDSLVTPYLVILNVVLNEQRGKRSLLILPDAIGSESFRRLRIALKWGDASSQVVI